jgi:hypothetical protein
VSVTRCRVSSLPRPDSPLGLPITKEPGSIRTISIGPAATDALLLLLDALLLDTLLLLLDALLLLRAELAEL